MSKQLLVTGATGLVGANLCQLAIEQGYRVRGLVRARDGAEALHDLGVELVEGDVLDERALAAACAGVDGVIHTAGALAGSWTTSSSREIFDVNYLGARNMMEAARLANVGRTICVNSISPLDRSFTLTECSPIAEPEDNDSSYKRAKRAALYDGLMRAALGQHISFVIPGAIYGPSPLVERAFAPASSNTQIAQAINGEFASYVDAAFLWTYVRDVAEVCLRAYERGKPGRRYIAAGPSEGMASLPAFCNLACEMAGSAHRVATTTSDAMPEVLGNAPYLADRAFSTPPVDSTRTSRELGCAPTSVTNGLASTVEWFRRIDRIAPIKTAGGNAAAFQAGGDVP